MRHLRFTPHAVNGTPHRSTWSSNRLGFVPLITAFLLFLAGPRAQAQDTTRVHPDSLAARLERAEAAIALLREQLATESESAVRTRSRVSLELRGQVLMNAFSNSRRVNNVDLPLFVRPDSGNGSLAGGGGVAIRQTTLGLEVMAREVLGGDFVGDLDVDFSGGQQPSGGGRTFPLLRLRTARAILRWSHAELLMGQEQPLVAGLNPVSLASIGTPGFTAAGNLWTWLPQARLSVQSAGPVRLGAQVAALAPHSGDPAGLFDTDLDPAERSKRPFVQGRASLSWGEDGTLGELGAGGHLGWVRGADGVRRESRALTGDALLPLGKRLELRGEFYDGQLMRVLGGGAIGQGFGVGGRPVRSRGGWGQLNVKPSPLLLFGVGAGMDDPRDEDLAANGRRKNQAVEAHLHWLPSGPLVVGFEWRQLRTTYASGPLTNDHFNLALGFRF